MTRTYSSGNFRRLYAGDFPELQAHFLADLSVARAQNALAPGLALVPGRLAALHLSRELAWNGTSHANLRFQTLGDYARELADSLRAERGLRMLPDVARDPIMKRAIENCGRLRYFSRVAGRAGFRTAVWNTIHDLRAAGLIAEELLQEKIFLFKRFPELDGENIAVQKIAEPYAATADLVFVTGANPPPRR